MPTFVVPALNDLAVALRAVREDVISDVRPTFDAAGALGEGGLSPESAYTKWHHAWRTEIWYVAAEALAGSKRVENLVTQLSATDDAAAKAFPD